MGLFAPGVWDGFNQSQAIDRQKAEAASLQAMRAQQVEWQRMQMEEARASQARQQRTDELSGTTLGKIYGGPPGMGMQAPAPAPGTNSAAPPPPPQPPQMFSPQGQQAMGGPPPGPPMQQQPPPGMPPQGAQPPPPMFSPQGQQAVPQAPPGPAPVPPYRTREAATQPQMPQGAPAGPGAPPPLGGPPQGAQPGGAGGGAPRITVQGIVQEATKAGAKPEELARVVANLNPMVREQLQEDLAQTKMQMGQANAYVKQLELGLKQAHETAQEKRWDAMSAQGQQRQDRLSGAGGSGGAGGAAGGGSSFEKLSDSEKRTVDFYAKQSLGGDNSWQVGLARGKVGQQLIQRVKDRIPELAEQSGQSAQDVVGTKAEMGALTKSLADRVKYSTAVEQLQGTLTKQADLVESLISKGASGSGSPVLNKWLQAGRKATGDPDVRAFNAAITGLSREHQRVLTSPLSNAQLHASASDTADKLINTADTPEAIRALIKVMRTEAANGKQQAQETVSELKKRIGGLGKGNKGDAAPSAGDTGQDAEAISWAKANPADPRAKKILSLHGM